jgi:DNA repair exonuclease SbcCD nuclease subunit
MILKGKNIGIFSDIHIGLGQDSSTWHDIVLDFAKWATKIYSEAGINDIIITGDIFHNRSEIGVNTISVANEFFEILKDFRIFISVGNHDSFYKDRSDVNSVSILKGWKNITIVDKEPLIIEYKNKKISLIPWGTSIQDIPKSDICFGHFEIQSFYMNNFKTCDHGFESSNILEKSPLVFSGHFHKKDDRKYNKGRIVYVGSPFQQNYGDSGDDRGIYTFNIETEELNFIENTISPKHIKIFLSKLRDKTQDGDYLKNNVPDNMVSLIIDEEITNNKIDLLTANIQKFNPKTFKLDYKSVVEEKLENSDIIDYNLLDMEKNIEDFVNSIDIEHKSDIIDYLNNLYKELIA